MYRLRAPAARRRRVLGLGLVVSAVCSAASLCAFAADSVSIVRIEEDWKLDISTPETNSNSPQVTCAMSPAGCEAGQYMTLEVNHQSQPGYSPGGLHLHAWDDEYLLSSSHAPGVAISHNNEHMTWTQSMSLENGSLVYEITQGQSDTWGTFGSGNLRIAIESDLTDLNTYEPAQSLRDSGVGFGSNRVTSLTLLKVRLYTSTGDVIEVQVNDDLTN